MKANTKTVVLLSMFVIFLSFVLYGCGGSSTTSTSTTSLTGTVQASSVEGAKICVKGTNECVKSKKDGSFTIKVNSIPVTLEVKAGDVVLGSVEANSNTVSINPLVLANDNISLAEKIGAVIHSIAGDTSDNASNISLPDNVTTDNATDNLIEYLQKDNATIALNINGNKHKIQVSKTAITYDNNSVQYNAFQNMLLWKLESFFSKFNGKYLQFADGNTCKIYVNPSNLKQFKLTNCSNPDFDSVGWETMSYNDNGTLIIQDEEGGGTIINSVSLSANTLCYVDTDDNQSYCAYGVSNTGQSQNLFNEIVMFFSKLDKYKVTINENGESEICYIVINQVNPTQFKLVGCDDSDDDDVYWETIKNTPTGVVVYDKNDESVTKIEKFENHRVYFTYTDPDTNEAVDGYFEPEGFAMNMYLIIKYYHRLEDFLRIMNNRTITVSFDNGTDTQSYSCTIRIDPTQTDHISIENCSTPFWFDSGTMSIYYDNETDAYRIGTFLSNDINNPLLRDCATYDYKDSAGKRHREILCKGGYEYSDVTYSFDYISQ